MKTRFPAQTLEKGMFLELFDLPCGDISIYALYMDFSLLISILTVCEHPPQCLHFENLSISTPHSDLVKLDAKVMLIHCDIRGRQHHKSKTDNPWRATDGQAFMNGLPFAPCTERKLG